MSIDATCQPHFPGNVLGVSEIAACHGSAASPAAPSEFSRSPYRQPPETVALAPEDQEAIYHTVLHFFRPAGGQVRWLSRQVLSPARPDSGLILDRTLAIRLVRRLGPTRFCLQDDPVPCAARSGGVLRVSPVYGLTETRARLVIEFQSVPGPYAPEMAFSVTEVFLVEKGTKGWCIRTHAPANS